MRHWRPHVRHDLEASLRGPMGRFQYERRSFLENSHWLRRQQGFLTEASWPRKPRAEKKLCSHLDHSHEALVSGGVSWDGEAAGWVAAGDLVHCIPGPSVGLVFVHHCQVGHDDIHPVLWNLPVELCREHIHTEFIHTRRGHAVSQQCGAFCASLCGGVWLVGGWWCWSKSLWNVKASYDYLYWYSKYCNIGHLSDATLQLFGAQSSLPT